MKRIRLTIEWAGGCSEKTWGCVLSEEIERLDKSGLTRVTNVEYLTQFGTTNSITLVPDHAHGAILSEEDEPTTYDLRYTKL